MRHVVVSAIQVCVLLMVSCWGGTAANAPKPESTAHVRSEREMRIVEARRLYRLARFDDAAKVLRDPTGDLEPAARAEMERLATRYEEFGRRYTAAFRGSGIEAYKALRATLELDLQRGGALSSAIQARLREVAPEAAQMFVFRQQYDEAAEAIRLAEELGATEGELTYARRALQRAVGAP